MILYQSQNQAENSTCLSAQAHVDYLIADLFLCSSNSQILVMVGGFFFFSHFFIGQASSELLIVTQREGLLTWGSLDDTSIHCREEKRWRSRNLCIPSLVPEKEEWPRHSLDSWCTLGGEGTGFARRSPVATPYRLSRSSSSANSSPWCSVIFPGSDDSYSLFLKI